VAYQVRNTALITHKRKKERKILAHLKKETCSVEEYMNGFINIGL
jgi:hypothetical protein